MKSSLHPDLAHCVDLDRRRFLRAAAVGAVGVAVTPLLPGPPRVTAAEPESASADAESLVTRLYDSLSDQQRQVICFPWNHQDPSRGLLRTRISANWHITNPEINEDFYTDAQRGLIREIFLGLLRPDWHARFDKQLEDDTGGFGNGQNIAIFGSPGKGEFQFVLTGRHMTLRCDGNSADHVAFGGPIFYGHAPRDSEAADHPGNVFWEQAVSANQVYEMLDGKQRELALVKRSPSESAVGFRGAAATLPGIPVAELSDDQQGQVQQTLARLVDPFRTSDREEVMACLRKQGGLEKCRLAFYAQPDIGDDRVWDNWRLEGPAFVWYFRGAPHVHVWVHVADSPDVALNA